MHDQDGIFFDAFKKLITSYDESTLSEEVNDEENTDLKQFLLEIEYSVRHSKIFPKKESKFDKEFEEFMGVLKNTEFSYGIIPYDTITQIVFEYTPQEVQYNFTSDLQYRGQRYFSPASDRDMDKMKMFFKIVRHINLALVQKNNYDSLKLHQMEQLKLEHEEIYKKVTRTLEQADEQYKNIVTQFITILGIFAAIMMGAFGAIEGFSNLFDNAKRLSLGKLLIVSSVGASAVILVLFFLLHSIAKLTGRELHSKSKENLNFLEKYPLITFTHGIFIFIALIGSALLLSNTTIHFSLQGLWWSMPAFWLLLMIFFYNKKKIIKNIKIQKNILEKKIFFSKDKDTKEPSV